MRFSLLALCVFYTVSGWSQTESAIRQDVVYSRDVVSITSTLLLGKEPQRPQLHERSRLTAKFADGNTFYSWQIYTSEPTDMNAFLTLTEDTTKDAIDGETLHEFRSRNFAFKDGQISKSGVDYRYLASDFGNGVVKQKLIAPLFPDSAFALVHEVATRTGMEEVKHYFNLNTPAGDYTLVGQNLSTTGTTTNRSVFLSSLPPKLRAIFLQFIQTNRTKTERLQMMQDVALEDVKGLEPGAKKLVARTRAPRPLDFFGQPLNSPPANCQGVFCRASGPRNP